MEPTTTNSANKEALGQCSRINNDFMEEISDSALHHYNQQLFPWNSKPTGKARVRLRKSTRESAGTSKNCKESSTEDELKVADALLSLHPPNSVNVEVPKEHILAPSMSEEALRNDQLLSRSIPIALSVQPHAIQPTCKFKRCATHVYMSHMIYMEQLARQPSQAGLAGSYPGSTSGQGNTGERPNNSAVKDTSMHAVSGSPDSATDVAATKHGFGSNNLITLDVAGRSQYLLATMQQNAFTSFSFQDSQPYSSSNKLSGQMGQLPNGQVQISDHLKFSIDQEANLPLPKQQQGLHNLQKANSATSSVLPLFFQEIPVNLYMGFQHQQNIDSTKCFSRYYERESRRKNLAAANKSLGLQNTFYQTSAALSTQIRNLSLLYEPIVPAMPLYPPNGSILNKFGYAIIKPEEKGKDQIAVFPMIEQQEELRGSLELQVKPVNMDSRQIKTGKKHNLTQSYHHRPGVPISQGTKAIPCQTLMQEIDNTKNLSVSRPVLSVSGKPATIRQKRKRDLSLSLNFDHRK